jgi:hypothetical protein
VPGDRAIRSPVLEAYRKRPARAATDLTVRFISELAITLATPPACFAVDGGACWLSARFPDSSKAKEGSSSMNHTRFLCRGIACSESRGGYAAKLWGWSVEREGEARCWSTPLERERVGPVVLSVIGVAVVRRD